MNMIVQFILAIGLVVAQSSVSAAQDDRLPRTEWVTLGTGGGPVVQLKRAQPANALIVGDAVYLFDVGPGTQRQMLAAGIALDQVKAIFLSHHHLDHVGGLGPLFMNRWINGLRSAIPLIGPPGTIEMSRGIQATFQPVAQAPLAIGANAGAALGSTIHAEDMQADLLEAREIYRDERIRVVAVLNDHFHEMDGSPSKGPSRSYAFRIETSSGSVVYSGDTGPSARLESLAGNADLLVCEVIDRPAAKAEIRKLPHLTPAQVDGLLLHMDLNHISGAEAAAMARRAGVRSLVFTHLVPGRDAETDDSAYLAGTAAAFGGPTIAARDLQRFSIEPNPAGQP